MILKFLLTITAMACTLYGMCRADDGVENGYIFTSPRYLTKGQHNELQLFRFGCLDSSLWDIQLFYKKDYNSNETLAQKYQYQIPEGNSDILMNFLVPTFNDTDYVYSGRLQINGTMCGKPVSGSDEVNFSDSNENIYIIQTDKPLYKPGQTVKFRVLKVDKNLKPSDKINDTAEVYVEDPKGTRLFQFKGVELGKGITQNEFPLSDEPVQGTWTITVSKNNDKQSTTFDVKEYELPKYEVKIKFPPFVLRNADTVPVSICAQYTYGKPVQARLNLNTSLEMYSYESSYSRTPILHDSLKLDGCYNYTINVTQIDPKRQHNYKRIKVSLNVIEDGTGVQVNKTEFMDRSYTPLNLDFNINSDHGQYYKPGLPYKGKLEVKNPDDSPAPGEPVEICATVSRKRIIDTWLATKQIKYCKNYTSDANGHIKYIIVPQNVDSTSINLEARSVKYTGDGIVGQPSTSAYLNPFYSPSGSFIQLENIENPIPCGTKKNIRLLYTAKENTDFQLQFQVLKQGIVVQTGSQQVTFDSEDDVSSKFENYNELINDSETQISPVLPEPSSSESSSSEENCPSARESRYVPHVGEVKIPIDVDASLSSSFTLLVFYVRDDRETVADSQKIEVEKCFKNQVTFEFQNEVQQPGTPTAMQITSSPNSLCGVKVVDKSVSLLDSNDQLTKDKIFQFLSDMDPPTYYSSDFCNSDKTQPGLQSMKTNSKVNPTDSFYSSSYEDSYAAFQDAGFLVISNLILYSRPCPRDNSVSQYDVGPDAQPIRIMPAGPAFAPAAPGGPPMARKYFAPVPAGGAMRPRATQSAVEVRNYFPETWLFQLQMTDPNGVFQMTETLPHTITEWDGSAVCINSQDGLGLSETTSIKGFQEFFISYTLPISVVRGEEFGVVVSINNYVDAALPIAVTLAKPQGFVVTSDLSDTNICIQPSSSESLKIKLKGTTVGSINITVQAETSTNNVCGNSPVYGGFAKDAITQSLEVEAEGFPNEKVNSILFCPSDEENKKFSTSYSLSLPKESVPDSARAIVDVSGNVMGPAIQNLNNLVSLPTGCGEQNMVKFTPNYLVLDYLTDIHKLTDSLKSNAIQNLNTGYQRELTYQHDDGSFSAFGENDEEGSVFLTAFVLRSFYQAKRYITIDDRVLHDAQTWIISRQQPDGCFPNVGQIIDSGIQGGLQKDKNNGAITAYVLASLLISSYRNKTVTGNAMSCLNKNPAKNPYETFLYAYAKALVGNKMEAQQLIDNAKPLANTNGGHEYYRNINGTKSLDVETAAYAVLANLQLGNSKSAVLPIIRYLSTNLNPSGGFYSTQDTCVGLDALSKFAKLVYKDPVDISVSVSGGLNENVKISEDNKLLVQRNKVSQVPSELHIDAIGSGCGLLQTSLRYNTFTPPEQKDFSLQVKGECTISDCKERRITTVVSYLPEGRKSGMSVVQVKMISGTIAVKDSLNQLISDSNKILRADVDNNQVNIYFKEISNDPQEFSFNVEEIVEVENPQPGTAKVFDYYAPEYSTSVTYTFGN